MTLVAALIIAAADLPGAAVHARSTRYLAFGPRGSEWILLEVASRRTERVRLPVRDIDGLAVSADGRLTCLDSSDQSKRESDTSGLG